MRVYLNEHCLVFPDWPDGFILIIQMIVLVQKAPIILQSISICVSSSNTTSYILIIVFYSSGFLVAGFYCVIISPHLSLASIFAITLSFYLVDLLDGLDCFTLAIN